MKTKKPYISPEMEAIEVCTYQMLANSTGSKNIGYGGSNAAAGAPTVAESHSFLGSLEEESEDSYW